MVRGRAICFGLGDDAVEDFKSRASGWGLSEKQVETLIWWHRMWSGEEFEAPPVEPSKPLSPVDAKAEIKKLMADPGYLSPDHPRHREIVAEVAWLHRKVYGD